MFVTVECASRPRSCLTKQKLRSPDVAVVVVVVVDVIVVVVAVVVVQQSVKFLSFQILWEEKNLVGAASSRHSISLEAAAGRTEIFGLCELEQVQAGNL